MGTQNGYEYEYDYYISYAESDAAWVNGFLIPILDGHGKKHHSKCQYQLGAPKIKEMESAAKNSRRILLILSPEYLSDPENAFFEFMAHEVAINQNKYPIIPVFRQKIELPLRLKFLVGLDLSSSDVENNAIERLLESSSLPLLENDFIEPPYPGLSKFYSEQKDYFYGREQIIRNYTQFLLDERCLFIVGASGSGKSSLVHAGILPKLLSKQYQVDKDGWLIKILEHPENKPFSKLKAILGESIAIDEDLTIRNLLRENKNSKLLLFIDQLEEVFQDENNENSEFFETILKINKLSQVYLIFTFRADFYHFLTNSKISGLTENHQKSIKALTKEELKSAIVNPALSKNVYIDPILVERLLSDAGDEPGILPFIQITMRILWKERQLKWIPLSKYEEIKDDTGSVVGLKAAISKHADIIFRNLPSNQHKITAKGIFIKLINFSDSYDDDNRRPNTSRRLLISEVMSDDNGFIFDETLHLLVDNRLLTTNEDIVSSNVIVDICHESLIEHWKILGEWVEKYRGIEEERRRLYQRALRFRTLKEKASYLDDIEVELAKKWYSDMKSLEIGIDVIIIDFLEASYKFSLRKKIFQWLQPILILIVVVFLYFSYLSLYLKYLLWMSEKLTPMIPFDSGNLYFKKNDASALFESKENFEIYSIKSFKIDKYEVSNQAYCFCIRSNSCRDNIVYDACDEKLKSIPTNWISFYEARDFCEWQGKRLPTEVEWEYVAKNLEGRLFPSGSEIPNSFDFNIDRPAEGPISIHNLKKDSNRGMVGLTGNVSEWTLSKGISSSEANIKTFFYGLSLNKGDSDKVVIRGGGFLFNYKRSYSVFRSYYIANGRESEIGFRCLRAN